MTDRVSCVHFTPAKGQVEANRQAIVSLAEDAAANSRVVVLPELCVTGFALERAAAEDGAEPLDGPTVSALAQLAARRSAVIVCGLALREADGLLRNAQVVLDADGSVVEVYAKHHLFASDHDWATAGERPGAVAETAAGRLGLLICHDVVYPRTVMEVARRAPRLLAFSTAWVGTGEPIPTSWQLAVRLLDPAPLVVANRGGAEAEFEFSDPSAILSFSRGGTLGPRGDTAYVLYRDL